MSAQPDPTFDSPHRNGDLVDDGGTDPHTQPSVPSPFPVLINISRGAKFPAMNRREGYVRLKPVPCITGPSIAGAGLVITRYIRGTGLAGLVGSLRSDPSLSETEDIAPVSSRFISLPIFFSLAFFSPHKDLLSFQRSISPGVCSEHGASSKKRDDVEENDMKVRGSTRGRLLVCLNSCLFVWLGVCWFGCLCRVQCVSEACRVEKKIPASRLRRRGKGCLLLMVPRLG